MKTLHLRLGDLSRVEYIVMARIPVLWLMDNGTEGAFRADTSGWGRVEGDADYCRVNAFIDRLMRATVGGILLSERLMARGVGLLQFAPSYIWPDIYVAMQLTELVDGLFSVEGPQTAVLYEETGVWAAMMTRVVRQVAATYAVPLRIVPASGRQAVVQGKNRAKVILKAWGVAYFVRHLKRTRRTAGEGLHHRTEQGPAPVMFVTLGERHWRRGADGRMADEQCAPIAAALQAAGHKSIRMIDTQQISAADLASRSVTMAGQDLQWRSFAAYGRCAVGRFLRLWPHRSRLFRRMMADQAFQHQLTFRGICLVPVLAEVLRSVLFDIACEAEEFLDTAGRLLEVEAPAVAVLTYETGPAQRAIIIEAARRGIPTVGLQHGMIFNNHYDYMHAQVSPDPLTNPHAIAVARKTCVWGSLWADVLTRSGAYPAENVRVTGNWRYDGLAASHQAQADAASPRRVAILSAAADIESYVEHCLALITAYPDLVPVVKLHPVDRPDGVARIIERFGLPPETLNQGDLLPLLAGSHVVISQFSTVVTEAILLEKDVILSNLTGQEFSTAYRDSGACLYIETPEQLAEAFGRILNDPQTRETLRAARQNFITETCYRVDGASAARVAQVVLESLPGAPHP